jgi:hypothetical protein
MQHELNQSIDISADGRESHSAQTPKSEYGTPAIYFIGRSSALLQGSGRHKNDDTGRPGFIVDQR